MDSSTGEGRQVLCRSLVLKIVDFFFLFFLIELILSFKYKKMVGKEIRNIIGLRN